MIDVLAKFLSSPSIPNNNNSKQVVDLGLTLTTLLQKHINKVPKSSQQSILILPTASSDPQKLSACDSTRFRIFISIHMQCQFMSIARRSGAVYLSVCSRPIPSSFFIAVTPSQPPTFLKPAVGWNRRLSGKTGFCYFVLFLPNMFSLYTSIVLAIQSGD